MRATASGNGSSVKEDWFPSLDHCKANPGCIGHDEAIYNALGDLLAQLTDPVVAPLAQTCIFDKLGNDVNGKKLTTASFIGYLTANWLGFYNGLQSNYCYSALSPQDDSAFCNWRIVNNAFQSIGDYLTSYGADAVTGTPSNPWRVFFNPSSILFNSLGINLGNEGLIFHEALHGTTGLQDRMTLAHPTAQIMEKLGIHSPSNQPSCTITMYIQENVLSHSQRQLDKTVDECPGQPNTCP